MLLQKVLEK